MNRRLAACLTGLLILTSLSPWAKGSHLDPMSECSGHGETAAGTVSVGTEGIAASVKMKVGDGPWTDLAEDYSLDLGYVCADTDIQFKVEASDKDEHVCLALDPPTNQWKNFIRKTDLRVTVVSDDEEEYAGEAFDLDTQSEAKVFTRLWEKTWQVPESAAGRRLRFQLSGKVEDWGCDAHDTSPSGRVRRDHGSSKDPDRDMGGYAAELTVVKVNIEMPDPACPKCESTFSASVTPADGHIVTMTIIPPAGQPIIAMGTDAVSRTLTLTEGNYLIEAEAQGCQDAGEYTVPQLRDVSFESLTERGASCLVPGRDHILKSIFDEIASVPEIGEITEDLFGENCPGVIRGSGGEWKGVECCSGDEVDYYLKNMRYHGHARCHKELENWDVKVLDYTKYGPIRDHLILALKEVSDAADFICSLLPDNVVCNYLSGNANDSPTLDEIIQFLESADQIAEYKIEAESRFNIPMGTCREWAFHCPKDIDENEYTLLARGTVSLKDGFSIGLNIPLLGIHMVFSDGYFVDAAVQYNYERGWVGLTGDCHLILRERMRARFVVNQRITYYNLNGQPIGHSDQDVRLYESDWRDVFFREHRVEYRCETACQEYTQ